MLFFMSIILHELGHSIVAINRGIRVRSITLFIFGGMAQTEKGARFSVYRILGSYRWPHSKLCSCGGVLYAWTNCLGTLVQWPQNRFKWLASINLMVALFNLVPGFPLDGGRVFRAIVWGVTKDAKKGMRWAVMSGRIVGVRAYGA